MDNHVVNSFNLGQVVWCEKFRQLDNKIIRIPFEHKRYMMSAKSLENLWEETSDFVTRIDQLLFKLGLSVSEKFEGTFRVFIKTLISVISVYQQYSQFKAIHNHVRDIWSKWDTLGGHQKQDGLLFAKMMGQPVISSGTSMECSFMSREYRISSLIDLLEFILKKANSDQYAVLLLVRSFNQNWQQIEEKLVCKYSILVVLLTIFLAVTHETFGSYNEEIAANLVQLLVRANGGCEIMAQRSYNMTLQVPIVPLSASVIHNIYIVERMCSGGICVCNSESIGHLLQERVDSFDKQNLIECGASGYAQCGIAISHVWADQLLLDDIKKTSDIVRNIKDNNGCSVWLDIAQKEAFNAKLCSLEYHGDVILVNWSTYIAAQIGTLEYIISAMLLSDWGARGWTMQETWAARRILIYTHPRIIELNVSRFYDSEAWRDVVREMGLMQHTYGKTSKYYKFDMVRNRVWRWSDDILLTQDWWTDVPVLTDGEPLEARVVAEIITGSNGTAVTRKKYIGSGCWIPTQVKYHITVKAIDAEFKITDSGMMVDGKSVVISGTIDTVPNEELTTRLRVSLQLDTVPPNTSVIGWMGVDPEDECIFLWVFVKEIDVGKYHVTDFGRITYELYSGMLDDFRNLCRKQVCLFG